MAPEMKLAVDLNADLGEDAGHDDELLDLVTSANIACGFHAGDAGTIKKSIDAARDRNVAVGAHPSLFDRENFGRKELPVTSTDVFDAVVYQLGIFQAIADHCGSSAEPRETAWRALQHGSARRRTRRCDCARRHSRR